ncbi:hypothetical protein M440DRAFT_97018 [Trichoderma longibrachiatum ATCC 18648]|uniref:Uncharacterized protein n=1 Tax=Trichoderma longibrachiatum ATCC 18648 TaxID=983965 RepID=A0A2T4BYY2_TRILO|nr:hypothetical protein M440DRAFT_97018 [Trichoderma longibrachiatum ATCC 18648]
MLSRLVGAITSTAWSSAGLTPSLSSPAMPCLGMCAITTSMSILCVDAICPSSSRSFFLKGKKAEYPSPPDLPVCLPCGVAKRYVNAPMPRSVRMARWCFTSPGHTHTSPRRQFIIPAASYLMHTDRYFTHLPLY